MDKRLRRHGISFCVFINDIPIQRAEAEHYISDRPDWVFDKEYIEKAVSAYKNSVKDREVLMEILEDAKERQFDILLTYMSDRIGRQEEYSFYVAALNRLGIEVWTIKDGQLKTEEHTNPGGRKYNVRLPPAGWGYHCRKAVVWRIPLTMS